MNPTSLSPYEVHVFSWGTAVKHVKGDWEYAFLAPTAHKVELIGLDVFLDYEGIHIRGIKEEL